MARSLHTAADGNGPVNALDAALRKALGAFYPVLDAVHLVDYKVRILDGGCRDRGPDAGDHRLRGRRRGHGPRWARDTNIIAASALALARLVSSTRSGSPAPSYGVETNDTSQRSRPGR